MRNLKNRVQLIGRLGQDPEVKQMENGNTMSRFSMATDAHYIDGKGEKVKETQWHNIVMWGKLAENMKDFLHKGKEILVEGQLVHRSYEDKEGVKRYISEVKVNSLELLGKNPN